MSKKRRERKAALEKRIAAGTFKARVIEPKAALDQAAADAKKENAVFAKRGVL